MQHIVKRKGHSEPFDERKLYGSVFAALMTLRISDEEAEAITAMVVNDVKKELMKKKELLSRTIHTETAKSLKRYHSEAAYMYDTHKDLA